MSVERAVRRYAVKQLNLFTRPQALEAGVSDAQLRHRVRSGLLHDLYPGVYLIGAAAPTFKQLAFAAQLACGDAAFVSHAAYLWDLVEGRPEVIDVTVHLGKGPRPRGVRVHRSPFTGKKEQTTRGHLHLATVERTLLDLARSLPERRLGSIVNEAVRIQRTDIPKFARYLRSKGAAPRKLRAIVEDRDTFGTPENDLETDAIRVLRSFGLPEPVRQYRVRVGGRSVRFDLAYPERSLAIELDGLGHIATFQADHDRHNLTELAGYRTLRFTSADVRRRPAYFAGTVADALEMRILLPGEHKNAQRMGRRAKKRA